MLCHILKLVLPDLISDNQSAFVVRRSIVQNILISQDIVRLYNRKATTKSCLIKIDLKKAYDTVEWGFVEEMLYAMNFPMKFIKWVMSCITTTQYSIEWGIVWKYSWQTWTEAGGSNISTYLCHMHRIFFQNNEEGNLPVSFADAKRTSVISRASGLCTNAGKSYIFSANMEQQCLVDLCDITGYQKGSLPFKYLGIPMSTEKLIGIECEILVDKMTTKIKTWGSMHLSYAGRVQLINSVLIHVHTYWASIFLLPKAVMKQITIICRNFLWEGKKEAKTRSVWNVETQSAQLKAALSRHQPIDILTTRIVPGDLS
ncbi:uncharacterized protein [Nicotiana sylvestris]|uniref:uncharacterized protein n=1 Tax=Nicotiana sylvestris TaxID=4096 RepID=UPI00388C5A7A